ncbi:hypothetical protein G5B47_02640 [Paenibacillus sp. 7124]|uniref:Uncharacterized protein n=1 Tax=Paenibacillus apii TaxID=1850370 RepID=A0A6M1PDM0_9BACL|nr:hypothetical protein [Paenibacillus apii]NGM81306.1 hypothetical protein [Paenibacillus apii]
MKASLQNLYALNYIIEPVSKLEPNKPFLISLNKEKFDIENRKEGEFFAQLPINVMFGIKDGKLTRQEARLLYYIKSYINATDSRKQFCFTRIDKKMSTELNMGKNTIPKYTQMLVDKKLISINKHNLGTSYQYDEDGKLIFTKYNNHYFLNYENIKKL